MPERFQPRPVFQLKRDRDHPRGSKLGSVNCNPSAAATLVDFVTCGATRTSGAAVRELTGDTEGGTTLSTVSRALQEGFGVEIDIDTGSFERVIKALAAGRGVSLCGSSSATLGTRFQASEVFDGNHQWAVTDIREDSGRQLEGLVFDPLADGRRRGIATAPMWMPVDLIRKFAGGLDLRSQAEKDAGRPRRPLGDGRATFGVTEVATCTPGVERAETTNLRPGASLVRGQTGRERVVDVAVARVREQPTTTSEIIGHKRRDHVFHVRQRIRGQRVAGSAMWFGNRTGERWMHSSLFRRLTEEGAEAAPDTVGEDPDAVRDPDAADDQGADVELLEGTEDSVDEEVVDSVPAESRVALAM